MQSGMEGLMEKPTDNEMDAEGLWGVGGRLSKLWSRYLNPKALKPKPAIPNHEGVLIWTAYRMGFRVRFGADPGAQ